MKTAAVALIAVGLFTAGAVVSIMHGVSALSSEEEDTNYLIGYIVLAAAFVFEGISFIQSYRQAHAKASDAGTNTFEHVFSTSNPTLRAVFAEDSAALVGLVIAFLGLLLHELTGNAFWDALGSILVGVLLAIVAFVLIERNRRFLVGQEPTPAIRDAVLATLLADPDVERVTYLRLEFAGPGVISVVGDVDLVADEVESHVAVRLRAVEARLDASASVAGSVLSLSAPDEPSLRPS